MLLNTLCLWGISIGFNTLQSGLSLFSPLFYEEKHKSWLAILYQQLGELPSIIFTLLLVDTKLFGRRKSMILFTVVCACLCLAASISVNRDETDQFTEISIVINLFS